MNPTDAPKRPESRRPDGARPSDPRRALGLLGEDLAAEHLERLGFAIVDRNVRSRDGEIDLIAFDGCVLAFVEVKTLRSRGAPLDSLRHRQRARIRRLATAWLQSRSPSLRAQQLRFDAIGIVVDQRDRLLRLDHVEGAW